jgi:hypothetical protein
MDARLPFLFSIVLVALSLVTLDGQSEAVTALPGRPGSVKFAVLGGSGTGERPQYELGEQMASRRARFPFDIVLLLGGNIQGSERPQDFLNKFETPYKPLLNAGARFYAALGTDDSREQVFYRPFHMDGKPYYTFSPKPEVRFFALETTYLAPGQIQWLDQQLLASSALWKIVFFHHPLYSSAENHDSDSSLRGRLEPLFVKHNVSVVLTGRERFYERVQPQKGITYFVVGSGGLVRSGSINRSSPITAKAFDGDQTFLAVEIVGDEMFFNAISRDGKTVDSGMLKARAASARLP